MATFLIKARYSTGSWSRMLQVTDDRATAAGELVESLGGSLERIYWDVESCTAFLLAGLPDSVTAAAVITTMARTGSFTAVEAHELLNQEQMRDAVMLAKDASRVYRPPGSAVIERDLAPVNGNAGHTAA
jgi:uncharacterized protein with GYD domain